MSLDISPTGSQGGGLWSLTAATDSAGIAGFNVFLQGVQTVSPVVPTAIVNNGNKAGFVVFEQQIFPNYREVVAGQAPLDPPQVILPNMQNVFYGFGSPTSNSPFSSGVPYYNIANVLGSPWGISVQLGNFASKVVLLSGTYSAGQYPRFYSIGKVQAANVFSAIGTSVVASTMVKAENIKLWQGFPGDADLDGDVDQTDRALWQSSFGTTNAATDFNRDGIVDAADYTVWRDNLGFNVLGP